MQDSLGFSPERLARIDRFLAEKYVAPGRLPCTLTLVARHGDIAHIGMNGHADVASQTAVAEDTIFRIYSMTKPITSVALMMLVEEGKIALEDPVHRFIPEWKNLGVYVAGTHRTGFQTRPLSAPMRVVDLMRHTAGLTYGFQLRSNVDAAYRAHKIGEIEKAGTLPDMIAALAKMPLEFSPGEAWNYSVATDVVGWLVEVVSGQKFEDFLIDRLFTPLGHGRHRLSRPRRPWPPPRQLLPADERRRHRAPGRRRDQRLPEAPQLHLRAAAASSRPPAIISNSPRCCSMAARANGHRYISRKTLDLMTANHLPGGVDLPALSRSLFSEAAYDGVGFGLGFATSTRASRTLMPGSDGDFFWGGAASTFFWVDPAEDLIGIFMTQLIPSSTYPVRREVRTMVYAALDD